MRNTQSLSILLAVFILMNFIGAEAHATRRKCESATQGKRERKLPAPGQKRLPRVAWTADLIIRCIQALDKEKVSLNSTFLQNDKTRVRAAIKKHLGFEVNGMTLLWAARNKFFGTWDKALEAAGFDPEEVRGDTHEIKWQDLDIPDIIRRIYAEGIPINVKAVKEHESEAIREFLSAELGLDISGSKLADAVERYYDSWDAALSAAGFDPKIIRKQGNITWTRDLVVRAVRHLYDNGVTLNYTAIKNDKSGRTKQLLLQVFGVELEGASLLNAWAKNKFGSWDGAILDAGIPLGEIRLKAVYGLRLNRDQVIQALKYLHAQKMPIRYYSNLWRYNSVIRDSLYKKFKWMVSGVSLYFSAYTEFESYEEALKAAKIPVPRRMRGKRPVPGSAIPDWQEVGEWQEEPDGSSTYNRAIGPRVETPEELAEQNETTTAVQEFIAQQSQKDQKVLTFILGYLEEKSGLPDLKKLSQLASEELGFFVTREEISKLFVLLAQNLTKEDIF